MRAWVAWAMAGVGIACGALGTRVVMNDRIAQAHWTAPASQMQSGSGLVFERADRIRRGLNLSNFYAQTGDYTEARLKRYMTVADMRAIRGMGFDHVRLGVDPEGVLAAGANGVLRPEAMARLDKTVRDLVGAGLNVVLVVQPEESWKRQLKEQAGVEKFFALWTALATHFAGIDPERIFFEVMNEPTMEDAYRWAGIQAEAVTRIRSAAPHHTVIATGAPVYSNIQSVVRMEPVRDENVIYTFHDYAPMWFTHQGAPWAAGGLASLRGVPYPTPAESIRSILKQLPDENDRLALEHFGTDRWDEPRMSADMATVERWAQQRWVPLYCGEFGVYRDYADAKDRVRWIGDMRMVLETDHIGWAMWDYNGNFGLVAEEDNKKVDGDVLRALGLGK